MGSWNLNYEDFPGIVGELGNMTTYFKGTRDIFAINLRELTLTKHTRNLFTGNKGEKK